MRRTLLLIPLLALAGCAGPKAEDGVATAGGGATPSAGASAATGGKGGPGDKVKFAQCMRDNGITGYQDPDPAEDENAFSVRIPSGTDKAATDKAMKACKQYMPNGGEPPGKVDPAITAKLREMAKCMRENGVPNFPDPSADGGIQIDSRMGIDPESAAFKAADEKCKQFRPEPPKDGNTRQKNEGS